VLGDLAGPRPAGGPAPTSYSGALVDAVKLFQDRHAFEPDGVIGAGTIAAMNVPLARRVRQIELALERERWLPDTRNRPLIFVNVPLFRLWGYVPDGPDEPLRMNVVVGKPLGHATPLFVEEME
jgi:murein L,D-transpeptidase YcbB/YkuD